MAKSVCFAIPQEQVNLFKRDGANFHFACEEAVSLLTVETENGWVLFTCQAPQEKIEIFEGKFLLESESFIVSLTNDPEAEPRISLAMQLESRGFISQAAAMWISLGKKLPISERVLSMHLARLQKKITKN